MTDDVADAVPDALWGLNLHRFRVLVAVADTGGFTAAAELLGYGQPQISRHIGDLESAFGIQLIDRRARPLRVTEPGRRVLDSARLMVREMADLHTAVTGCVEKVVVGMHPSAAALVFPALVAEFRTTHPDVEISLVEGQPQQLDCLLESGVVDVVLQPACAPANVPQVQERHIWTEPLVAVVRDDDPLATRHDGVAVHDLVGREFIRGGATAAASAGSGALDVFGTLFTRAGVVLDTVIRSDCPETIASTVRAGLGTGLSSAVDMSAAQRHGVAVLPLLDDGARRRVVARWKARRGILGSLVGAVLETVSAVSPPPHGIPAIVRESREWADLAVG